ncbi:MAG: hypothetical protein AAB295_11030 [Chloroflexota bacterium]
MAKGAKKVDLQIRGMPADLRRRVEQEATRKGMSMSRYVIASLEDDVIRPATLEEWFALVEELRGPPRDLDFDPAESVRAIRDAIEKASRP